MLSKIPTLIMTGGGLGFEGGCATVVTLSNWHDGKWPPDCILLSFDAAEDTGRKTSGVSNRLTEPPPNRFFMELLPDTNLAAIGRAEDKPEFQQLFEIVPAAVLAAGVRDTASVGAYQRPGLATALFVLHFEKIDSAVKAALAELKSIAGEGRAEILVISGGNGSIGSAFGMSLTRLVRERTRNRPLWRVAHLTLAIQPDGRTPDAQIGRAVLYGILKDLAICAGR